MKIFITGIAGFLGSHLADEMLKEGHEVYGCDNLIGGYMDNVPKDAVFHKIDCNDLDEMKRITKDMDIVYHTACTAYEGFSVFAPKLVCENTYLNTVSVATAAISNNVKRIVTCSSMARYGKQDKVPFTEDMICKPVTPYGISKYAGELALRSLCDLNDTELVIAVPHNIIGPRQKYDDPYRNIASIMINLLLQGKQPIIYGDGEQKRCFSFVQDDITCLKKMAFQDNVVGEVINIGPDEEFITLNELGKVVTELMGMEYKPRYVPDRPLEVKYASCSADKARKLLGYKTEYTLRQGLSEMIEYIKNRGTRDFDYTFKLEINNDKTPCTWKNRMF